MWKLSQKRSASDAQKPPKRYFDQATREAWVKATTSQTRVKTTSEHTEASARTSNLAQDGLDVLFCSHGNGKVDVSAKHNDVENDREWSIHVESRFMFGHPQQASQPFTESTL